MHKKSTQEVQITSKVTKLRFCNIKVYKYFSLKYCQLFGFLICWAQAVKVSFHGKNIGSLLLTFVVVEHCIFWIYRIKFDSFFDIDNFSIISKSQFIDIDNLTNGDIPAFDNFCLIYRTPLLTIYVRFKMSFGTVFFCTFY